MDSVRDIETKCSTTHCHNARYFDVNEDGQFALDGAWICPACVRALDSRPHWGHALVRDLEPHDIISLVMENAALKAIILQTVERDAGRPA